MRRLSSKLTPGLAGAFAALALATASACSAQPPSPPATISAATRGYYVARLADNDAGRFDLAAAGREPLFDALVTWDRLRRDNAPASFGEIAAFLQANPGWPGETTLRRRAEKLIDDRVDADARRRYFDRFPPLTADAQLRLAEADLATGRAADAIGHARVAWISAGLDATAQAALLGRFGSQLTPADHLARADWLLWSGQAGAAAQLLPRLPADRQPWIAARVALRSGAADADSRWHALTAADQGDAGIVLDRALYLRNHGDVAGARAVLARYGAAPGYVLDPETWLKNRLEFARAAYRAGDPATAYRIAAGHRALPLGRLLADHPLSLRLLLTDTEWTAGWLALRKLGRAADAQPHFEAVRDASLAAVSQARGDYWTGRAAEAAGDGAGARAAYAAAAVHVDYFYGQLAAEKLGRIAFPPTVAVTVAPDARAAFERDPLVRIVRALGDFGDRGRQTLFMKALVDHADSLESQRLLGDLGIALDRPDLGVLTAKTARGDNELKLRDIGYPLLPLPSSLDGSFTMIHAIARQESQFDRAIVSRANARGLMQLLPGTAADTAAKLGMAYSTPRLTDDPVYNATLGAAYFARIRDQFGGSYILSVAAYNAGPGNARKFIAANGDPRDAGIDPVDWIEAVPFAETRDYLQRVLANAVVYDLAHPATAREDGRLERYLK